MRPVIVHLPFVLWVMLAFWDLNRWVHDKTSFNAVMIGLSVAMSIVYFCDFFFEESEEG